MKHYAKSNQPEGFESFPFISLNKSDSIEFIDELILNGMVKDAMTYTIQAKMRFPDHLEFVKREADIYFSTEAYDKALQLYDKLEDNQSNPKRLISLAVKLMNSNKLTEASTILNKLKTEKCVDIASRAYSILADISFLSKDYRGMYRWSREAIKRNPFLDSFAKKFFMAVELTNNHHRSIPFYETLLDDNPYSSLIWMHLAKCHDQLGYTLQAKDCMDMVTAINTAQ